MNENTYYILGSSKTALIVDKIMSNQIGSWIVDS